ncbi:hypothetical protein [Pseudomonas sp. NPDC089401]|uniref:hypothetical protein n=1 Tax=Pseudomonas sp. NPDC089401 TaxID=3364462 RepID=UPI0038127699
MATISAPLLFQVRQQTQILGPPSVIEANDNLLDPLRARHGATVRVQYAGMQASDSITVTWAGEGGADSVRVGPQDGSTSGHVDFTIPIKVIAASQGKAITVTYEVTPTGQPAQPSQPLILDVGQLPQTALPTPMVPQANQQTGELDLGLFPGDAQVYIAPWPLIAEGQRYWISASGVLADGTPHVFPISVGQVVTAADLVNGVRANWPREELAKLKINSGVTIMAQLTFDGSNDEQNQAALPPLSLSLLFSGMELLTNTLAGVPQKTWRPGEVLDATTFTLVSPNTVMTTASDEGQITLTGNATGASVVEVTPKQPVRFIKIASINSIGTFKGTIQFYNDQKLLSVQNYRDFGNYRYIQYLNTTQPITRITINLTPRTIPTNWILWDIHIII